MEVVKEKPKPRVQVTREHVMVLVFAAGILLLIVGMFLWWGAGPTLTVTGVLVCAGVIVVKAGEPGGPRR